MTEPDNPAAGHPGPLTTSVGGPTLSPDHSPFGAGLAPAVHKACGERLSDIHWFRTDWQRGGAITGYATYADAAGDHPVVVKMPVPPREHRWLQHLQPDRHGFGDIAPRVYASGDELEHYDFAWVVMERLPHGPIDSSWQGNEWALAAQTLGRFYAVAAQHEVDKPPREEDWPTILRNARKTLRDHGLPEEQRWNKALKQLQKKLKKLLKFWDNRDVKQWCHGDVHLANFMSRNAAPDGPALLFDYAEVHAGHWIEDAVYLEHLYWARPDRTNGCDIVKIISQQRKANGLKLESHWPRLADVRRALLAGSALAYLRNEGNPLHVRAALHVLEETLSRL